MQRRLPRCVSPFQSVEGHWKFGHTLMNLVIASVQSLLEVFSFVDCKKTHIFVSQNICRRLTLLCFFGCSTWSCTQRPPCILCCVGGHKPAAHVHYLLDPSQPQVSSQMLKQFGYGETNAVMVRGPVTAQSCWDLAVRFQTVFGLFGNERVRHAPWKYSAVKHCLAVVACAGLIDAVHAAVLASAYMAIAVTTRSWNAPKFPWNPSL